MSVRATWRPKTDRGGPNAGYRTKLPQHAFAFPKQRRAPLTDAIRVQEAVDTFWQIEGVSDKDRDLAFANIKKAARYYGVTVSAEDWHDLAGQPQPSGPLYWRPD